MQMVLQVTWWTRPAARHSEPHTMTPPHPPMLTRSDSMLHPTTVSCCSRGLSRTLSPNRHWPKATAKLTSATMAALNFYLQAPSVSHRHLWDPLPSQQWWPRAERAWSTSSHQAVLALTAAVLWHIGCCYVIQAPPYIRQAVWLLHTPPNSLCDTNIHCNFHTLK